MAALFHFNIKFIPSWLATYVLLSSPMAQGDHIGMFYALDADLQGLKSVAQEIGQPVKNGTRAIHRLQLGVHTVYATKMGSGAVETAASAQALLTRFRCDWAFSLGPAGALKDNINTGCWYKVNQVIAWQHSSSATPADFPSWDTDWARFPATNAPPPLGTASNLTVASGELFVSSMDDHDKLQALTQAGAVDMNSYGLALVCADHGVPLFSWKVISDRADEEAAETFKAFTANYSGEGGKALAKILQSLPPNPNDPSSYPAIEKILRESSPGSPITIRETP